MAKNMSDRRTKKKNLTKGITFMLMAGLICSINEEGQVTNNNLALNTVYADSEGVDNEKLKSQGFGKFTDINGHWVEDIMKEFYNKGIIDGLDSNTLAPDRPVTRAEFVKIMNGVFDVRGKTTLTFKDTKGHWAQEEISVAYYSGLVKGDSKTKKFNPNDVLTREDAAVIMARYFDTYDKNFDEIRKFDDVVKISDYAKASLEHMVEKGYLKGFGDGTIRPKRAMTRAEVCAFLKNFADGSHIEIGTGEYKVYKSVFDAKDKVPGVNYFEVKRPTVYDEKAKEKGVPYKTVQRPSVYNAKDKVKGVVYKEIKHPTVYSQKDKVEGIKYNLVHHPDEYKTEMVKVKDAEKVTIPMYATKVYYRHTASGKTFDTLDELDAFLEEGTLNGTLASSSWTTVEEDIRLPDSFSMRPAVYEERKTLVKEAYNEYIPQNVEYKPRVEYIPKIEYKPSQIKSK